MMQSKLESDDSEAETEILSALNTPLKGRKFAHEDTLEAIAEAGGVMRNHSSPQQRDPVTHGSGDTISVGKKRKPGTNEAAEANGSPVWSANEEGNEHVSLLHSKREGRSRSHSQSMSIKKRTRPVRRVNLSARSDATGDRHFSDATSPDATKFSRSQSPRTHFTSTHNKHLKATKDSSLSSQRASTQEPRSRSPSLTPPATRLHKRSSSFHSALAPISRERRLKIRRDPHLDNSASHSRQITSPSLNDAFTVDQLTPSHTAHMSARVDRTGRTALARACEKRDVTGVKSLLENVDFETDINFPDNAMNRPIQFAALQGSFEIVQLLIDAKCEVDVANSDGDTPLIDAIARGHIEIIELLLRQNINPNRTNKEGKSPEDFIRDDEEHMEKILELLQSARSRYIPPKTEASAEKKKSVPLEPLPTGRSRRDQHIRNDLFYVDASLQHLYDYAEKGDVEGVRHMLNCGIKADNDCAVAAASRGHRVVLELLFDWGMAPCDLDPDTVDGETPMLAAISRGHLEIVELLLSREDFNVHGTYKGKHYNHIAVAGKGSNWKEVAQTLKKASKRDPRRRRLVTRKEMEEMGTLVSEGDEEEEDGGAALPANLDTHPASTTTRSASPALSAAPSTPPRPSTPPEVLEQRQRQEYLATLPEAVALALTPSGRIRGRIDHFTEGPGVAHLKELGDWMPIPLCRRAVIEPGCSPEKADELWILGLFVPVFLRQDRLDSCKTLFGWETLPVTEQMRADLWARHGLAEVLCIDHNWEKSATSEILATCGMPTSWFTDSEGHSGCSVQWKDAMIEGKKKWLEMEQDQCFWVKLADFVAETVPEKAPFIRNLRICFEDRHDPAGRGVFRWFMNGRVVAKGDPHPSMRFRTVACPPIG